MSGIFGIVGHCGPQELKAMAQRMAYRGGYYSAWNPAPHVHLAEISSRFASASANSCLALDVSGPLYPRSEDDRCAPEQELDEHRARLESTLCGGGMESLLQIQGHFALAFWSARQETLLLATDRHCYKTLYYVQLPGRIAFASDCKALLALPDCPAQVERQVLQTYLRTLEVPIDRCLLQGVNALAGARAVVITDHVSTPKRYWNKERREASPSLAEASRSLRQILESVISRLTQGHRRIGLTLSGGLDSAALLALSREVRPDLEIATYTIGHGPEDPEIVGAREAAEHFGTEHHEHFFPLEELPEALPRFVWLTEDLMGREETVLQQVITTVASARDRVIMAGNGADLAFGGMPRHRLLWLRDRAPWPLRGALNELFVHTQTKNMPDSWLGRWLVRGAYGRDIPLPPQVIGAGAERFGLDFGTLVSYQRESIADKPFCYHEPIDTHLGMTMLAPFSTPEVMEFALGCPAWHLVDRKRQKLILRAAVADLLPARMSRRGKAIQRLRHDSKLSDVLDSIARSLGLDSSFAERGLLSSDYVRTLRTRSVRGAYSSARLHMIWGLICAELWMRCFVDARGVPLAQFSGEIRQLPARGLETVDDSLNAASTVRVSHA